MKDEQNDEVNMLDAPICGCGTVREALDAIAAELNRQIEGEDCVYWHYVVSAATAMVSLQVEKLLAEALNEPEEAAKAYERYVKCLKIAKHISEDSQCLRYIVEKMGMETEDMPNEQQHH